MSQIESLRYAADHTGCLLRLKTPKTPCLQNLSLHQLYYVSFWSRTVHLPTKYLTQEILFFEMFSVVIGSFSFTCSIFPTSVLDSGLSNQDLILQEYEPGKLRFDPPPLYCSSINHYCDDVCVFIHCEAHSCLILSLIYSFA